METPTTTNHEGATTMGTQLDFQVVITTPTGEVFFHRYPLESDARRAAAKIQGEYGYGATVEPVA